jgi:hypothetical protein
MDLELGTVNLAGWFDPFHPCPRSSDLGLRPRDVHQGPESGPEVERSTTASQAWRALAAAR